MRIHSLVSLYTVWVYKFTGVEWERHILCSEVANVMFLKLKWVVFTALGCTRCFCTSDRLWSTFTKVTSSLFSVILSIWCVIPRWDKNQGVWQTVMILMQLNLFDCFATWLLCSRKRFLKSCTFFGLKIETLNGNLIKSGTSFRILFIIY